MNKEISVLSIENVSVIHLKKGCYKRMQNRKSSGISFCREGKISYTMNGKNIDSTPEKAVFLPEGASYELYVHESGSFPLINFRSFPDFVDEIEAVSIKNPDTCLHLFDSLIVAKNKNASPFRAFSILYEILEHISIQKELKNDRLDPLIRFIDENISDPEINNLLLAEKLSISEVYLRKLFLNHFGTSPRQYVLDQRIKKAKEYLSIGALSVTEISHLCGFCGLYHFCRTFKKRVGMTPMEFTKQSAEII